MIAACEMSFPRASSTLASSLVGFTQYLTSSCYALLYSQLELQFGLLYNGSENKLKGCLFSNESREERDYMLAILHAVLYVSK